MAKMNRSPPPLKRSGRTAALSAFMDRTLKFLSLKTTGGVFLLFLSLENWDDIWRRNQFICAELARRFPDMHILFVAPPRDVSNAIRTRNFASLRGGKPWHPDGLPNITIFRPLKFLPNSLSVARVFNEWLIRLQIRRATASIRRLRMNETALPEAVNTGDAPVASVSGAQPGDALTPPQTAVALEGSDSELLWINAHDAVHLVGRMGESKVIYDITDDWTKFSHFTDRPALRRLTIAQDARLCQLADDVIVCSQALYDSKKELARRLHLIPNGVDAAHYAAVIKGTGPLPPDADPAAWPRPVYGYTGSIHADRVDVDMVAAIARLLIARNLPGTLVLLGPNMLSTADSQRLLATGRVALPGPRPYHDLPQFMRAFDVCMTPHCMTEFVESLNPIKLWEYLAAGKPIVSTDVAGFRDFPDLVRIARTPEEFLAQLQAALAEGTSKAAHRQATAASHTWQARVDQIVSLLSSRK